MKLASWLWTFAAVASLLVWAIASYHWANTQQIQYWDEATNVAVVVESAQAEDWWNLRYDQDNFWEKPPLYYWLGIVVVKVFSLASQAGLVLRLISLLAGLYLLWRIFRYLQRGYSGKVGIFALLLALATPFLWAYDPHSVFATHTLRSADLDTLQLLFIWLAFEDGQAGKYWKLGLWSALAYLTKGPLALVIPLCTLAQLAWQQRQSLRGGLALLTTATLKIALPFSLVLAWIIATYLRFGESFLAEQFGYHQLARVGSSLEGHQGGLLFHLDLQSNPYFSGLLLWLGLGIAICLWRRQWQIWRTPTLWLAAVYLIIASIIQTKLSWYGLYFAVFALPATAIVWQAALPSRPRRRLVAQLGLAVLLALQIAVLAIPANQTTRTSAQTQLPAQALFVTAEQPHRYFWALAVSQPEDYLYLNIRHEELDISNCSRTFVYDRLDLGYAEISSLLKDSHCPKFLYN